MTSQSLILMLVFFVVLLALAYPLGKLISQIADEKARVTGLHWLRYLERGLYKLAGVKRDQEMG